MYETHRNVNGSKINVEPIPAAYRGQKLVWQVNHGSTWKRIRNWFETKKEAVLFARTQAQPCSWWEDIYVVWYSGNGAIRWDGKLLGHRNAEKA